MAPWKSVSPWGSFRISFSQACCIECLFLWLIVDIFLYLTHCDPSPSCFDPVCLLLAHPWLRLSRIGCISTTKHFHHQKQAAESLHQQQAAGEAEQRVERTLLKLSRHSWLGSRVCVLRYGFLFTSHLSWLGFVVWVCVLGLGSRLRPATPGWGVRVCVCLFVPSSS